ncbi:MAG: 1-deoxy-D-xylulose-5-phosphate synthase [Oligoflexia bacterium]|nr:1-deoxy-D-xylulose-5-phosphate synthase [Oligoflexia bacterium]
MIRAPEDLRKLPIHELRNLAEDLRQEIISTCLRNGGHLGASLGAVELAIALHFVFESPREPIVWDVGHQAYAHKLLTGRWDRFQTLRREDGISGFLRREESEHDAFGTGHSSTALSAALAMAWTRGCPEALRGRQVWEADWTVAVIGDGGLTSGIAFEALNMIRDTRLGPLLLIVNDNQMSISRNAGAVPAILSSGEARDFFELFGFDYLGPIDGHDLGALLGNLQGIKANWSGKPVLLHVITEKGKGYAPAEARPATYHGISGFEPSSGGGRSFSQEFGDSLCALAERDPKIVAITAAMAEGTGLAGFARKFPERFFDVGIAEGHAVTFAAGLATQGFKPVVAIYSTFLQRAYDSIIHDVALQELGVVFAVDRAGVVGADGPTHHGAFDLGFLSLVPNLRITSPAALEDMRALLEEGLDSGRPWVIRYPRGTGPVQLPGTREGGVRWLSTPGDPRLFALGMGSSAPRLWEAAKRLDPAGERITVAAVSQVKPLPQPLLEALAARPEVPWLSLESGTVHGGFGESVKMAISSRSRAARAFSILGYGDHFIGQGPPERLEELEGLSVEALVQRMRGLLT